MPEDQNITLISKRLMELRYKIMTESLRLKGEHVQSVMEALPNDISQLTITTRTESYEDFSALAAILDFLGLWTPSLTSVEQSDT